MKKVTKNRWGFTLIETFIALGVVILITVVVVSSLFSRRGRVDLDNTTRQIAALMREAQSRSMAKEGGAAWGVRIENGISTDSYVLFKAPYSSSTIVGYYKIPSNVQFASSSIPQGSFLEITFAQVSGVPSTSTTVGLNLTTGGGDGSIQASIGRTSSGKIFFDDFNRSSL